MTSACPVLITYQKNVRAVTLWLSWSRDRESHQEAFLLLFVAMASSNNRILIFPVLKRNTMRKTVLKNKRSNKQSWPKKRTLILMLYWSGGLTLRFIAAPFGLTKFYWYPTSPALIESINNNFAEQPVNTFLVFVL